MASISIRDLSLSYDSVSVLERLNLDIETGEFIVLLGPSGCGKSTLLNCIAGLLDASGGQVIINDRNVTWDEPKDRGIGMVFQSYALYPQMTVRGNLSFGLKNARLPADEIEKRVSRAASLLQIETLLDRKPAALSGGQRQRVAIGRALVRDVDVFLFDEPLSNLDAKLRAELRVEIKRLHQRLGSNTMVYVTHDQIEAMTLADRIAVMRGGKIQQLADPQTIYNRPTNEYVAGFIGSPSMNFVDGSVRKADGGFTFAFGDVEVPLADYQAEGELKETGAAKLGLRPEHVALDAADSPKLTPVADGVVELDEPMGSDNLVWVKVGGVSISSRVEGSVRYTKGQNVRVSTEVALSSLFDSGTEGRI